MFTHTTTSTSVLSFLAGMFTLHYANTNTFNLLYVYLGLAYIITVFLLSRIRVIVFNDAELVEPLDSEQKKDTLYFMFAPWCGYSKKTLPLWRELEEHYQDDAGVELKLIDSEKEENESILSKYKVESYPTFIYEKGSGDHYTFKDERTVESLQSFIDSHKY